MRRIALLLCLLLVPGMACAHTVVLATDWHYIAPTLTDNGPYFTRLVENSDGKMMPYSEALAEAFVWQLLEERPDAVILSGDLTFNGAWESHRALAAKLERLTAAGISVLVLPGNHDLNNSNAAAFSGDGFTRVRSTTAQEFADLYGAFGYAEALSRDAASLSYTAELVPGVRVLMLDVNGTSTPGDMNADTLAWMEMELERARNDHARVLAVSHQNVMAHNTLFIQGFVYGGADEARALLEQYGVKLNLSGHMHAQHQAATGAGLTEIATSSLAVAPCQYGVITLDGAQAHYRTRTVDVPGWAARNGRTEETLLRFPETAADFFTGSTARSLAAQIGGPKAEALAQWAADANLSYFAGRQDRIDKQGEEARFWQSWPTAFGMYLNTILREPCMDHTVWDGEL